MDQNVYLDVCSTIEGLGQGKWVVRRNDIRICVEAPEGDPDLKNVLAELAKAGWKPFFGEDVPMELTPGYVIVRRDRSYSEADLNAAKYLSIVNWGGEESLFFFLALENGTYVAEVTEAQWKWRMGTIGVMGSPPFVRDDLRQELLDAGLVGLDFLSLRWNQPEKAKTVFWQLSSTVTMPPCLLPRVRMMSFEPIWYYDDAGHHPQELVFRQSQVEAMESFDAAVTAEEIMGVCGMWNRRLVVSQRFRTVCRELKLKGVTFAPIRLVSDDWQRPLTDHDRFARGELRETGETGPTLEP